MRDGMEKGAPVISRKQYMLICALAGLLILGGVLIFSAHSDLQNAEKQFEDTISYVKEQCTGYDNLNLASETKSLMRMMENAQHLCREIAHDRQDDPARVLDDRYGGISAGLYPQRRTGAFGRGQNFVRCLTGWPGV